MTDKQLRALSKTGMLTIMHQQEKEIERLTGELHEASNRGLSIEQASFLAESAVALSEILQVAQDATKLYIGNIQISEMEKKDSKGMTEEDERAEITNLYDESDRKYAEIMVKMRNNSLNTLAIFDHNINKLSAARTEYAEQMRKIGFLDEASEHIDAGNSSGPRKEGGPIL